MNEKMFKTIVNTGIGNLVCGIITVISGITLGVLLIISGARLLKSKEDMVI